MFPRASTNRIARARIRSCSTAFPTIKPGTSIKKITGRLKASQRHISRMAFRQASGSKTPALNIGLFPITPTEKPSSLPNPVVRLRAYPGCNSIKVPGSSRAAANRLMSFAGIIAASDSSADRSARTSLRGAFVHAFDGR